MKLHLAMSADRKFPTGEAFHVTYTLCGRENAKSDDGANPTPNHAEVTCGHCLRLMRAPWFQKKAADCSSRTLPEKPITERACPWTPSPKLGKTLSIRTARPRRSALPATLNARTRLALRKRRHSKFQRSSFAFSRHIGRYARTTVLTP